MQIIDFLPSPIKTADNQPSRKYVSPTINTNKVWMKLTPLNLLGSPIIQGLLTRGFWSLFPTLFLEFWKLLRTRGAMWQCVIISPVLSSNCVQIPRSKTRHQTSESQTGGPVMSIIEKDSHWNFKTLEAQLDWLSPPGLLRQLHHLSWQSWSVL